MVMHAEARWCCADALFDGNRAVGVEFDRDSYCHTYAPAVLVGEKAADMMRQSLPRGDAQPIISR